MFTVFSKAINRYLQLDSEHDKRFAPYLGNVVAIKWATIPMTLYVEMVPEGISLTTTTLKPITTTIEGDPISLAMLGLMPETTSKRLSSGDVKITGDVEFGQQLQQLLHTIEIDWEEHISHYVGDIAAHQIATTGASVKHFIDETAETCQQNVTEYLQEELRQLPGREEVNDFFSEIDQLVVDADRLIARFDRLQNTLTKSTKRTS